jgi:nitrite reductase (NADH) small subunit
VKALALQVAVSEKWEDVCSLGDVLPGTGVCALVAGRQVAIVRAGGAVYAIGNFDPFSKAYVLSRGIVGDRGGVPKIASPIYKQSFDLRTGVCLDDPGVRVPTYEVRVERGRIFVRCAPRDQPRPPEAG